MGENQLIIRCTKCGAKNRVPENKISESPKCGKCGTMLRFEIFDTPVNVTDANFDQEVMQSSLPVLVDCWAPWCGPCRAVGPILDGLAKTYRGRLKIAKVNVDENPGTGSKYRIQSIPTMLFVKNGSLVDQVTGALPKEALEARIKSFI
ncbi:thiol reductase thioredoxin [Desulfobacter hydrogenophilus]|uniref:Thioredoxin n=1 Tax=Desulfobacter hydrogenophilus TaxID=2291 RepID=A0A328F8M2_9BACT|nr:thioredoxin TrxC [Desulfobacter hydrogenophilus]NDY73701.1 thioredoxin TrxC [Desulfobacter hydrogenophilus]QBH11789.1 thioredoxin TrxC [Desulfobacter hydrogenophilus]RAM00566.1 thiol reductase thioredoxin [Desulfobacter hydrogenophilus]